MTSLPQISHLPIVFLFCLALPHGISAFLVHTSHSNLASRVLVACPWHEVPGTCEPSSRLADNPLITRLRPQAARIAGLRAAADGIVVVAGASGRVGRRVVREVLEQFPKATVRGLVRDPTDISEELQDLALDPRVSVQKADLLQPEEVKDGIAGANAVIWCATDYSDRIAPSQRFKWLPRMLFNPSGSADVRGVRNAVDALEASLPGVAAAVTRPSWSAEQREANPEAAEVPIVKLNTYFFRILDMKRNGEKQVESSNLNYAVIRVCALNDNHPRGRAIFSTGDTATGRICRDDAARILAGALAQPALAGRVVEVFATDSLPPVELDEAVAEIDRADREEFMRRYPGSSWITKWYSGDGKEDDNPTPEPMMSDPEWKKRR